MTSSTPPPGGESWGGGKTTRRVKAGSTRRIANTAATTPKKAKRRKSGGAPSMATLPDASMRIPDALKEGRRTGRSDTVKSTSRPADAAKPRLGIDRLIAGFPDQSMVGLRQQWLNLQRLLTTMRRRAELVRFERALLAEWERRQRSALADPDHFEWPSTDAARSDDSMPFDGWHGEGMLAYLGYRVGATQGLQTESRRQILDTVFAHALPPVNGPAYVREWASPASAPSLQRLANEIARLIRNAKRKRSSNMDQAIADWEDDLRYLHHRYYVGLFGFGWPSVLIAD